MCMYTTTGVVLHLDFFFLIFKIASFRPQAVMATGQVLFHRFYCKKSFARFNVKVVLGAIISFSVFSSIKLY